MSRWPVVLLAESEKSCLRAGVRGCLPPHPARRATSPPSPQPRMAASRLSPTPRDGCIKNKPCTSCFGNVYKHSVLAI